jgi:hypothetical protein
MFFPWDDYVKVRRDLYVKVTPKKKDFIAFWENADRNPLFPLYWSGKHFSKSLTCHELECGFLDDDDEKTFNNLHDFVTCQGMPIHCWDVLGSSRASPALCLCIDLLVYCPLLWPVMLFGDANVCLCFLPPSIQFKHDDFFQKGSAETRKVLFRPVYLSNYKLFLHGLTNSSSLL